MDIITGLDIGTSKVCVVVGELLDNDELNIVGVGCRPSHGFEKGVVVDFERLCDAIKGAIEDAEMMCGYEIDEVFVGVAGTHISGQNSKGLITISQKGRESREILENDVFRVIESAQYINLPTDREIIHVLPWEFVVDGQHGVKDPIGMSGVRMEAEVHIITGSRKSTDNVIKCVNRAGYMVKGIVLEPLACAETILNEEEKELGSLLIDIGGGITNAVIFVNGNIRSTYNIPLGGKNVTHDIAYLLRTSESVADNLKINHGAALGELVLENENIEVPVIGGRAPKNIPRSNLCEIIECRMDEILRMVKEKIQDSIYLDQIAGGIVLTGGGTMLEGTAELAEKVFQMPARLGIPKNLGSLDDQLNSPVFSTAVGLVQYALREIDEIDEPESDDHGMGKVKEKFKKFWDEIFA